MLPAPQAPTPTGALNGASLDFSGSPNAPVYAKDAAGALDAYNTALANTATKRQSLYNQAGFKTQTDAQGNIVNYSVDGLNPTGQYQQLQRKEGQQLESQHEVDASRGIGGAGIAGQGTSNLRFANGVEQANFANAFQGQNAGLTDLNSQAFGQYQSTLLQLQLQSIADARNAQNFPDEGGSSDGGGPATNPDGSPNFNSNKGVQNAGLGDLQSAGQLKDIADSMKPKQSGFTPLPAPAPKTKGPTPAEIQAALKKIK